ncbi:MAG: hypothetical protein QHH30_10670 [candidate division NC10 bacterium]|nr:hypothetical protein [candidate division NC10 bacterium]
MARTRSMRPLFGCLLHCLLFLCLLGSASFAGEAPSIRSEGVAVALPDDLAVARDAAWRMPYEKAWSKRWGSWSILRIG